MTHGVFPHIPAGLSAEDADSWHVVSGEDGGPPTQQPPGRRTEKVAAGTTVRFSSRTLCLVEDVEKGRPELKNRMSLQHVNNKRLFSLQHKDTQ